MKRRVACVLIEPRALFREALTLLLASTAYKLTRAVPCVEALENGPKAKSRNTLFIVRWKSSKCADNDLDGRDVRLLKERYPSARVLVLADGFDAANVVAALRAGASGYLLDTTSFATLMKSLDLVMLGESVVPAEFTRAMCEQGVAADVSTLESIPHPVLQINHIEHSQLSGRQVDPRKLSSREAAILSRLTLGDSNKTIARNVGIAEATVKTHIKAILRKISVRNRTQAALWALNNLQPLETGALEAQGLGHPAGK